MFISTVEWTLACCSVFVTDSINHLQKCSPRSNGFKYDLSNSRYTLDSSAPPPFLVHTGCFLTTKNTESGTIYWAEIVDTCVIGNDLSIKYIFNTAALPFVPEVDTNFKRNYHIFIWFSDWAWHFKTTLCCEPFTRLLLTMVFHSAYSSNRPSSETTLYSTMCEVNAYGWEGLFKVGIMKFLIKRKTEKERFTCKNCEVCEKFSESLEKKRLCRVLEQKYVVIDINVESYWYKKNL